MYSPAIVAYICEIEGFKAHLYEDCECNATIGYGHLVHYGPINGSEPEEFKRGLNKKQALALLHSELGDTVNDLKRLVKVPLNQNQYDALLSFTFNVGAGHLAESTLLKKLNAYNYAGVPLEIRRWVKADGCTVKGLVRRREYEAKLFSTPI